MKRRTFSIITFMFVLCAAGTTRAQSSDPCSMKPPSDPEYYADMKEMPRGKWGLANQFEKGQFKNDALPVLIRGLGSVSSQKQRAVKFSCVELENRSSRVVKSVQLRWSLAVRTADRSVTEGAPVVAKGTMPVIEVEIQPGVKLKAEIRGAHYADFLNSLSNVHGEVNGDYVLYVGIARIEYTDGTFEDLP